MCGLSFRTYHCFFTHSSDWYKLANKSTATSPVQQQPPSLVMTRLLTLRETLDHLRRRGKIILQSQPVPRAKGSGSTRRLPRHLSCAHWRSCWTCCPRCRSRSTRGCCATRAGSSTSLQNRRGSSPPGSGSLGLGPCCPASFLILNLY